MIHSGLVRALVPGVWGEFSAGERNTHGKPSRNGLVYGHSERSEESLR